MFYIDRKTIPPFMTALEKHITELDAIRHESFFVSNNQEHILSLKKEEAKHQELLNAWAQYKNTLGTQSKEFFDYLENDTARAMIYELREFLTEQQEKQAIQSIDLREDYVFEWERQLEKKSLLPTMDLNALFSHLVKTSDDFEPFLACTVHVQDEEEAIDEGDLDGPFHVYRKNTRITITNINLKHHPLLVNASKIDILLSAFYNNGEFDERTHILPYRLFEKVTEQGFDYDIHVTLHNGCTVTLDQLSGVFDSWTAWANNKSNQEAMYVEAFKQWFLLSIMESYEKSQQAYYQQSTLHDLCLFLKEEETKHYVLKNDYRRYTILTTNPTLGQLVTNFYFDDLPRFFEPTIDRNHFENLLSFLSLFNQQSIILFPSEEEQLQLLETIVATNSSKLNL